MFLVLACSCLCTIYWNQVDNEDAVGAVPTMGDAPTTSEWSTILLPTKVRRILETWRYLKSVTLEEKDPFILLIQWHGCWCPGDARSQGISSHDINLVLSEYSTCSSFNFRSIKSSETFKRSALNLQHMNRHWYRYWSTVALLPIIPLGTNLNEILIKIQNFSFMKMNLKKSSVKWQPFCPGGDEFNLVCGIQVRKHKKIIAFHHFSTLRLCRYLKSVTLEDKDPFFLHI